jgi:hypothetical protein
MKATWAKWCAWERAGRTFNAPGSESDFDLELVVFGFARFDLRNADACSALLLVMQKE